MKLASLKYGRDGKLVVVSKDLSYAVEVEKISPTMQHLMDNWQALSPELETIYQMLNEDKIDNKFKFDTMTVAAPLPRAYHWADGSAYVTHVELVRKARNAELPESFWSDPLMYMGASDAFIGARDDVLLAEESWGIDFEAEVAVITDDVPAGISPDSAQERIKLITLVNDISLRNLIPAELAKQFGFYQSKPWTSFSPVAITPDELGEYWDGNKLSLPMLTHLNGVQIGAANAGIDMTFNFGQLIAHAAKTRSLMAGTVVGSGTVANDGSADGSSCLAEVRCLETIQNGQATTPFMKFGDRVEIEMKSRSGESLFGKIDQKIVRYTPSSE
ncbi:MAG: fumarylacetoacetate hydrolase family protein [Arenicella sp.]